MKCDEIQDLMPEYWDKPEGDWTRVRIDEHVKRCKSCSEVFELWKESGELLQEVEWEEPYPLPQQGQVSASVMKRIYEGEGWRVPVAERLYSIPTAVRMRLLTLIAGCMALFLTAFLYRLISPEAGHHVPNTGLISVSALGGAETGNFAISGIEGVPVASIGDPVVLGLYMVDSYPDYLFVLSMLGLIGALLTMNWLARLRA